MEMALHRTANSLHGKEGANLNFRVKTYFLKVSLVASISLLLYISPTPKEV
jgi:hypothetical protein